MNTKVKYKRLYIKYIHKKIKIDIITQTKILRNHIQVPSVRKIIS